jgi:hypothetical protein
MQRLSLMFLFLPELDMSLHLGLLETKKLALIL